MPNRTRTSPSVRVFAKNRVKHKISSNCRFSLPQNKAHMNSGRDAECNTKDLRNVLGVIVKTPYAIMVASDAIGHPTHGAAT